MASPVVQGPPIVQGGLPLGPPVVQGGLPLGPSVVQGGLPLGPAGVGALSPGLGDARNAPEDDSVKAEGKGVSS